MKRNTAHPPASEARLRGRLRAAREIGHSVDCAAAFALRRTEPSELYVCLCDLDRVRDQAQQGHSGRAVA